MQPIITKGIIKLVSELKILTEIPEVLCLYKFIDSLRFCERALLIGTIALAAGIKTPSNNAIKDAYPLGTGETS